MEKNTPIFCKDTNSCEQNWFERVVIQNDQVEWVNNLLILQGGTYGKQVGHSIEFNEKTPSCKNALYPGLKDYFRQVPKFLHLKTNNVKNVLIS